MTIMINRFGLEFSVERKAGKAFHRRDVRDALMNRSERYTTISLTEILERIYFRNLRELRSRFTSMQGLYVLKGVL